jgi:IS605 OrfB family transposase
MPDLFYPTLLQSSNIKSNSWFDIKGYKNKKRRKKKTTFESNYIDTIKIKLSPNEKQKEILKLWLNDCIDVYNHTNTYIKNNINNDKFGKIVNFINIRKNLKDYLRNICLINNVNKHTIDYSIKHCVEMYKSAESNKKNNNIKDYEIKDLDKDRRRKNLVIEPLSVSKKKNAIFIKQLGEMKSSHKLDLIKRNSILQFDRIKKTYHIIVPINKSEKININRYSKCGIDIGVRTFLTVYSPEETYEIGTNTNKIIDKYNKRLDKIKSNENKMSKEKYERLYYKYSDKLRNKINDMHNKSASFLIKKFDTINIGKVSTKKMVSNLKGNLHDIVKRRLMALSHYRFRMKLHTMSKKYNCNIIEIDEYMTSKKCSKCQNIKGDLKAEKTYECIKCNLKIDRDINASINIYKL